MQKLIKDFLKQIGEDPKREGLRKTPERVAESWKDLTSGYSEDPKALIQNSVFRDKYDEMVLVKDIVFYSMCEHHLLPFFGHAHIAYIPNGRLVGISKIARMVEIYAKRLQVQERMTQQIAEMLNGVLKPKGVAVVIEAEHLCMQMRGVKKTDSKVITSAMLGAFRSRQATREEFISLIK
jgi:GTP cyclohydrolase IA